MSNEAAPATKRGMRMRDLVLLSILALLSVAARSMLRIPIRVPGHSYTVYMLFLVFACSYIGRHGAAIFMGLVASIFGVIGVTQEGFMVFFHFFVPALVLEAFLFLPFPGPPVVRRIVEGLVVAESMLVTKSAVNVMSGQPYEVMLAKLVPGIATHTLFGFVAGILAYLLVRAVKTYTRET